MQQLPDKLRVIALQSLNSDEKTWWVRDTTVSYGKLALERLYWIIDSDDNALTIAQFHNDEYASLNGKKGLLASSALLAKSYGEQPWNVLGVEKFAKNIVSWFQDPRSYILTDTFFTKQQVVIQSWLMREEKDPAALKALCHEPIFNVNDNNWRLSFNSINRKGGVERWEVQGRTNGFTIDNVEIEILKKNGTFYFPDEL